MRNILTIGYILFAILIAGGSYARQTTPGDKKQAAKIDSMTALADEFFRLSKFSTAQQLLQLSVAEAKQLGYRKGEGSAYVSLGNIAYATRNFLQSEQYGRQAIDIFDQLAPDTMLAKSWVIWATAVWAQSRFNEAVDGFEKARQLFDQNKDSTGTGAAYGLIAMAEEERGNYERAFQYSTLAMRYKNQWAWIAIGRLSADVGDYDAALDYYARVTNRELGTLNYMAVGEAYFLKKNYDSALYYYRYYIYSEPSFDNNALSKPYALIGEIFLAEKKFDSSLYYLQIALSGFKAVNDRNWVMRSLLELGKAYKEAQQPTQALGYTRELLNNAEQTGARQYARDAHYLLYELFAALHLNDSAYTHLRAYTTLNNAIDIDMSARKLAFFKASAQLEQAGLKIDLLNKQKQLQQEDLKQASQQKIFLLVGIVALIVLFIILARNFFLKKRSADQLRLLAENELEIEKLHHTKKLSELEMQVLRVQMNPHFIFNSLNSINRFILRNNKTDASEYLTKFSRLVRMILQNSQNAVITLENELDSLKLYLELEMLRFDHQFTYNITIDDGVDIAILKVPPLVIQPFVENAIWHGLMPKETSGRVDIHISSEHGFLFIKITDDGVGRAHAPERQQAQAASHRPLGLQITSQRINMTHDAKHGILPVCIEDMVDDCGNPAGTEVTLKLPLQYD